MNNTKVITVKSNIADVYDTKYFKTDYRTIIYFHDWQGGPSDQSVRTIVDAYAQHGGFNIIIADWSGAAKDKKYHQFVDSIENVCLMNVL